MSGVSIEHNRRAVFSALNRALDDRALLLESYEFWEDHFSNDIAFRVSSFLDGLGKGLGLKDEQRRSISIALYSALGLSEDELPPIPDKLAKRGKAAGDSSADANDIPMPAEMGVTLPAPYAVLASVVIAMTHYFRRKTNTPAAEFREEVAELAKTSKLSKQETSALIQWFGGEAPVQSEIPTKLEIDSFRNVINIIYMAMCELGGPRIADEAMGTAVKQAEKLDAAQHYSPSKLL